MNTSLTERTYILQDVARIAQELLGESVSGVEPIGQGANSRVFQLKVSLEPRVLKFYFQHPDDPRDRLGTEFKSLSFLWDNGFRNIPQSLKAWAHQGCALYTFIKGEPIREIKVGSDIDQAVDFVKALKTLAQGPGSKEMAPASEAYFSGKDIVKGIQSRLDRLLHKAVDEESGALRQFLDQEYIPLFKSVVMWSKNHLSQAGISYEAPLFLQARTLSSSDFGFHNALRRPDGKIVFLDFEYFGWDDPVKLVSDFLWHPAMTMPDDLRRYFVQSMAVIFGQDPQFKARLKSFYPLFGLKWCLIFLNEFLSVDARRRDFARPEANDKNVIKARQLKKARALCERIKGQYENFPYES